MPTQHCTLVAFTGSPTMHAHDTQAFAAAKGEQPPSAPPALPRASREEMESAAAAYHDPSPPPSPRLSGGGSAGVADLPPHPAGPPVSPPPTNRHRYGVLCDSLWVVIKVGAASGMGIRVPVRGQGEGGISAQRGSHAVHGLLFVLGGEGKATLCTE